MLAIVQNLSAEHADVANAALAKLKAERTALQAEFQSIEARGRTAEEVENVAPLVATRTCRFDQVLREGSVADRKAVLKAFVSDIIIRPDDRTIDLVLWRLPNLDKRPEAEGLPIPRQPGAELVTTLPAPVPIGR